jgi:hypothetical protein
MGKQQINEFGISGKVLFVGMPAFFSDNMSKRTLVMEVWVDSKYKQEVAFDFVNQKMDLLNNIRPDDWVDIDFVLRGRKHIQQDGKARWFNNLEATTCTKID